MAEPFEPVPVKYFIAVLFSNELIFNDTKDILVREWGNIDYAGAQHLFDITDYYDSEMGAPQIRQIITFEKILTPEAIVVMKLKCNEIEENVRYEGKRVVNLDAGYLDHNKVLLASAKDAGQKVYLGKGIYGDLAGRYKNGKYQPFEWSFPDFKDGRYDSELCEIRSIYMKQLKSWRKQHSQHSYAV